MTKYRVQKRPIKSSPMAIKIKKMSIYSERFWYSITFMIVILLVGLAIAYAQGIV